MASSVTRLQVLGLYKKLLRTSQKWQASTGNLQDTKDEQIYIRNETKTLFRKNKQVTDPGEISLCIREAESRLEMAVHYQSPYPRPVNIPYQGLSKGKKAQDRLRKQAKPVYLHSHDEVN
ncbi:LYR motif-containing protein 1-like [Amphiura filiformis]|uniref:LYR motif-containing protein 1-like n=1 Tax=Amphiura filiformis TaxID=82378 RepID=UPI003B222AAF